MKDSMEQLINKTINELEKIMGYYYDDLPRTLKESLWKAKDLFEEIEKEAQE